MKPSSIYNVIDYDVFAKFITKAVSVRDKKVFLIDTPLLETYSPFG